MREKILNVLKRSREGVMVTSNGIANFINYPTSEEELADEMVTALKEEIKKTKLGEQRIIDLVTDYHFSGKQDRHILARNAANAQLAEVLKIVG